MKMKYIVSVIIILIVLQSNTAQAFTINYSSIRKFFAPQLATVSLNFASSTSVSDFYIGNNIVETVLAGSVTATTSIKDVVLNYYSTGSVEKTCTVFIQDGDQIPTYIAINPSIATINQNGSTTYVSNGAANFNVKLGRRTKTTSCNFDRTNNTNSYTFNSLVSTSTVYNMKNQIDSKISGKTPSSSTYDIFSSINDSTHVYTRNINLFASSTDLTCRPVFSNSVNGNMIGLGALVAPDILLQANHSSIYVGTTVYFVTSGNTTISRTIISNTNVPGTDIAVLRLSSDLPGTITPCKVFSSTAFNNSISTTSIAYTDIPVIFTNQFRTLRIGKLGNNPYSGGILTIIRPTISINYYNWYSEPIGGDSGAPAFAIVNNQAVLLGNWWGDTTMSNISNYISQINAKITASGSSYSLTTVDLSGFTTF